MPSESNAPMDLLDLKLLPAWVKETPDAGAYAHYEGETEERPGRRDGAPRGRRGKRPPPNVQRPTSDRRDRSRRDGQRRPEQRRGSKDRPAQHRHLAGPERPPLQIGVRFVPHPPALESVTAQIKADLLAYSLFSLARLFLQKPERYDVHLTAKAETPLFQLGGNGLVSSDRQFLENNAFHLAQKDFYKIDISQSEPIKGNFSSVARDRLSGTLLGPTNHHAYQPRLRTLYEQRFSRRMSFPEFQRQIEIVSDPALVEQWKEEARTVTTFTALTGDSPVAFSNAAEAERHFRQNYLPNLIRPVEETTVGGVASRTVGDRALRRAIEDAWSAQNRSPSQMMAELSNRFRETGLHIFRHRKGMLFVTPVRVRPFGHEQTSVSAPVRAILDFIGANSRINRKDLAEKVLVEVGVEEIEARKLGLASDLRWLISEGYVIEFNDGSLDLPRAKVKAVELKGTGEAPVPPAEERPTEELVGSVEARPKDRPAAETAAATLADAEIGGA